MKITIKIVSLSVALLMLAMALIGCATPDSGNDGTSAADTTTVVGDTSPVVTEPPYKTDNPELNFEGKTVKVLSRSNEWVNDEIWSEGSSGEPVESAVFARNASVEEELKIVLQNDMIDGNQYAVTKQIRLLRNDNSLEYDFFANSVYSTIMYTSEGNYADLYRCDYIEFEQPWFSQNFIDVASAGDKLYMITGSLALSMYRFVFATFYNEQMLSAALDEGEDIYDIVMSGKWTIKLQTQLAEKLYSDKNGNSDKDENDVYGLLTNGDGVGVDPYWSSCELPILKKTSDNYYEYALDLERTSNVVDDLIELLCNCRGTYSFAGGENGSEQVAIRTKFAEGGAAMATLRIIEAESAELRENEEYGIIPIPKYEEKQKTYYSFAHDQMTAFGIVSWLPDEQLQRAGAVLNAMNRHSIITVQPVYYELALKAKYLNDEKSWQMLDMIVKNLYLDAGVLYTKSIDSIHQYLREIEDSGSNNVGSKFADAYKYEKLVDDLVKGLQNVHVAN